MIKDTISQCKIETTHSLILMGGASYFIATDDWFHKGPAGTTSAFVLLTGHGRSTNDGRRRKAMATPERPLYVEELSSFGLNLSLLKSQRRHHRPAFLGRKEGTKVLGHHDVGSRGRRMHTMKTCSILSLRLVRNVSRTHYSFIRSRSVHLPSTFRRSCLFDFLARRAFGACSAEFSYSHMRFAHNCAQRL